MYYNDSDFYANDRPLNIRSENGYCVITEQGDLGLGADVLKETDQKLLESQLEENK